MAERPATAGGRGGAPGPGTSLLPDDQVTAHGLVVRGIEAVEGSKHQLSALEKSVDALKEEVSSVGNRTAALDGYLSRIARAEEERTGIQRVDSARREEWATKLWQSPTVQMGMMAVIVGLMQFFGLRWLAESYLPTIVHTPGVAP